MMGKFVSQIELNSSTLELSQQTDGFWLWDTTREMNLSMKAKTSINALVEALHYYQRRLLNVEQDYTILKTKVDSFLNQFGEDRVWDDS